MNSQKVKIVVTPAKAGAHKYLKKLDSRLRGNDGKRNFSNFYEIVKVGKEGTLKPELNCK